MSTTKIRLAVYGKGGIGKSTIAANLSVAFATLGCKVLQIGCDPKHDSTRLLLGGERVSTVLEHLEQPASQSSFIALRRNALSLGRTVREAAHAGLGLPEGLTPEKILHRGFAGVLGVEAGGPIPGIGCAGRGILSTFELLERLRIDLDDFDVILYDVLGDVVCGGFGVPLRDTHANRVLLVSSEEYMPIYAANNILRGMTGYQPGVPRALGLFFNRRGNQSSDLLVRRFTESVGLPVVAEMPRSERLREADGQGRTLLEASPGCAEALIFLDLARRILAGAPRFLPRPLEDEELERAVLGREPSAIYSAAASGTADVTPLAAPSHGRRTGPLRIAIYGKGGIGKSTIAANISAALAARGLRVAQIGCDPKHDSTRLLLGGRSIPTILETIAKSELTLEDVAQRGEGGVCCMEIGGPRPAVGCAGRGLLSAFGRLERLGFREEEFDVILYDVLGDVVCGGFAIPLRKEHAQAVLLVTSEEFMSLYAANNILSGIRNVSGLENRVLGLVHNTRDNHAPTAAVDRFAAAVGLPVVTRLPRSDVMLQAEAQGRTVVRFASGSEEARTFARLAEMLLEKATLYEPRPLVEEDLERVVLHGLERQNEDPPLPVFLREDSGVSATGSCSGPDTFVRGAAGFRLTTAEAPVADPYFYRTKPIRPPVWECAFHAATLSALKIRDAIVVAHSPASCAHMRRLEAAGMCAQTMKKRRGFYPDPMVANLVCTNLSEQELIYGGTEKLIETLKEALQSKPPVVFLITSCVPAIIGDNIAEAIQQAQPVSPETRIMPLRSDGNLTGGGLNGYLSALVDGYLGLSKPELPVRERSVNFVLDWAYEDSRIAAEILEELGISVSARFSDGLRDTTVAALANLSRAPLTLICNRSFLADLVAKLVAETLPDTVIVKARFPRGMMETEIWLREIAAFFGLDEQVERIISRERLRHEAAMKPLRAQLKGKRLLVLSHGQPVDDVIDAALDAGMEVPLIALLAREQDCMFRTRHAHIPVRSSVHPVERLTLMRETGADAVFGNVRHDLPCDVTVLDTVGAIEPGFRTTLNLAERWARLLSSPRVEGWKRDVLQRSAAVAAQGV